MHKRKLGSCLSLYEIIMTYFYTCVCDFVSVSRFTQVCLSCVNVKSHFGCSVLFEKPDLAAFLWLLHKFLAVHLFCISATQISAAKDKTPVGEFVFLR